MDALSVQKSAGHANALDKRYSQRNFVLDSHAGAAIVKSDAQTLESESIHLVSGDFAIATGIAAESLESVCIRIQNPREVLMRSEPQATISLVTDLNVRRVRVVIGVTDG